MRIIDVHVHYLDQPNYLERLVETCRELKYDRMLLQGTGPQYHQVTNEEVAKAIKLHPDLIVGLARIYLGEDPVHQIDTYRAMGFRGLKVISPPSNYDDPSFFPYYERAEALGMPVLFHTGIVARFEGDRAHQVSSARMQPIFLDTLARAFPGLTLIGAHLGGPWFLEASDVMRLNPNVYFDLSCSLRGWVRKTPDFFRPLLWWEGAWSKVLYATDVENIHMGEVFSHYRQLLDQIGIDEITQRGIFGGTAARIFSL